MLVVKLAIGGVNRMLYTVLFYICCIFIVTYYLNYLILYRIGTKKFFRLQELSFEAEGRLKKGRRHVDRSEIPGMETFVLMQEAISMLQAIAQIQPAWE